MVNHYSKCPNDMAVEADPGKTCATVTWDPPPEKTDHHRGGDPGDCFRVGSTEVRYEYEGAATWHWLTTVRPCQAFVTAVGVALEIGTTTGCLEACSWQKNHCWPGDCSQQVASNCVCRPGFKPIRDPHTNGRRCDLDTAPKMDTCLVKLDGRGDFPNPSFSGNTTKCGNQEDGIINVMPDQVNFTIQADQNTTLSDFPNYILNSTAGLIEIKVTVIVKSPKGNEVTFLEETMNSVPNCSQNIGEENPQDPRYPLHCKGTLNTPNLRLQDGESLCIDVEAISGGYYRLNTSRSRSYQKEHFQRLSTKQRICYLYDESKPVHCSSENVCNKTLLEPSSRLTRTRDIQVSVDGWIDPIPPGGQAAKIAMYKLEVHEVNTDGNILSVKDDALNNYTQEWNASDSLAGGPYDLRVQLPEDNPRLYVLLLEVHDNAGVHGNVGYARRLVLYDNSSSVKTDAAAALKVVSANGRGDLQKLKSETNENTDKKKSAVSYGQMSWSRDAGARSAPVEIPDVLNQTSCLQERVQDGETYNIWITATDIMGNQNEDSVQVSIDHTGPSVSIEGLRGRFGRDGLYVHNTTDLSSMLLLVRAADPHSGIKTLEWTLGTRDLSHDLGSGAIGVNRRNVTDCNGTADCYCPSVGPCEIEKYLFNFPSLVSNNTNDGQHHREYYITITATNHASFRSRKMIDILIDESPPTVGVVLEGLSDDDQAEMDFTSSDVVHVRWHGFLDHESGILLYRVVLADRCLTDEEMNAADNATDVEGNTAVVLKFPKEGMAIFSQYVVSVVAYNGAMQPSGVACSDGITFDSTPPALRNVSITHAHIGRAIECSQPNHPWLINANLTRAKLSPTKDCLDVCLSASPSADHLPFTSNFTLEEDLSTDLCLRLRKLTADDFILLPSDYLRLSWIGVDEESEMEEYHVGMGRDRTTASAPDLLPFTPTHGHHSYHARHSGLGHGAVFFIFLRALSKAGLQVNLTLGPVIIDVTPPVVTRQMTAEIDGQFLVVTWTNETFQDPEHPSGLDFDVTYRVGYEESFVTPFLTLPESSLSMCLKNDVTGCARYPISALQAHDTEEGRSFFFQLHVANAAGHVTTVNTSSVKLPAHFPPSHGVVADVVKSRSTLSTTSPPTTAATTQFSSPTSSAPTTSDDDNSTSAAETITDPTISPIAEKQQGLSRLPEFSKDVDLLLQREEICIAWSGFYHAEEVSIEVGVGTAPKKDDVVPFFTVADKFGPVCLNASNFPSYTKLFSVVKATSSGGTATFSSDGFLFLQRHDVNNKLMVFNGKACTADDVVGTHLLTPQSPLELNLTTTLQVLPGDTVFVKFSPFVEKVAFPEAVVIQTTLTGYQIVLKSADIKAVLPTLSPTPQLNCSSASKIPLFCSLPKVT
ncbi:hypothetical protein BaRGS_00015063 [Batillaria attramentaria]|uniref:Uncharacterized protein n=1 Tax=Batillaria attramentaria TaxID=370345 RepID=A0ABD0L3L6_9CAEN